MSNVKHSQTQLRKMARQAKSRLVENDYVRERKNAIISELPILESKLYFKILDVIERENEIINPIAALIDRPAFEKLSPVEKQRELFRLSSLYRTVKDRLGAS